MDKIRRALTEEERATLPALPSGEDRQYTWVVIAAEGQLVLPLREDEAEAIEIDVTPDWIDDRVDG